MSDQLSKSWWEEIPLWRLLERTVLAVCCTFCDAMPGEECTRPGEEPTWHHSNRVCRAHRYLHYHGVTVNQAVIDQGPKWYDMRGCRSLQIARWNRNCVRVADAGERNG